MTQRVRALRLLGWLGATLLLVYFARQIDVASLRGILASVRWQWIAGAVVANAMILLSWAGTWWTVAPREERVPYGAMFEINAMASALMNTLPWLGGHAAAAVLLVKRGGMTQAGALSVMALDQLGEGLAKVTLFGFVGLVAPIPGWMRVGIATACVAVGALLIGLFVAAHGHARIGPSLSDPPTAMRRARAFAAQWAERLETLRSLKRSVGGLSFSIGTKVAEGMGLLAVQHAFGVELTVGATSLVLAAVILGSILPVAPGNVGTYEAGAFLAYRHLGIEPGLATVLALSGHVCFMIPSLGIGYLLASYRSLVAGNDSSLQPRRSDS